MPAGNRLVPLGPAAAYTFLDNPASRRAGVRLVRLVHETPMDFRTGRLLRRGRIERPATRRRSHHIPLARGSMAESHITDMVRYVKP